MSETRTNDLAHTHELYLDFLLQSLAGRTLREQIELVSAAKPARPILKWAGGKTQLLPDLLAKAPPTYNKYIEPFFGGGALFFALRPRESVIADGNPELVNLYRAVADHVDDVIASLLEYTNTESAFYAARKVDWESMSLAAAAARTIFLNKTCFNGLYRVNKKAQFNVPFGNYKKPRICDHEGLRAASEALRKSTIVSGDYLEVLQTQAEPGDFIFLDPPYLPISEYADFKRYTKEQFLEDDHRRLAAEVARLHDLGCHVVLTNSNHPLVHDLYSAYPIEVLKTKRHISSKGQSRSGEDVIVSVSPKRRNVRDSIGQHHNP